MCGGSKGTSIRQLFIDTCTKCQFTGGNPGGLASDRPGPCPGWLPMESNVCKAVVLLTGFEL